jgi:putative effector of murein hydrolase LrgA (UPF0299 family)
MIRAIALLLTCQLIGEVSTRALAVPVPGPVIGLVLLAIGATVYARLKGMETSAIGDTDLGAAASMLLGSLGLLFVPAGAGIVQQLPLVTTYLFAIFVALLVSTVLTLLITVYVFIFVKRAMARGKTVGGGS